MDFVINIFLSSLSGALSSLFSTLLALILGIGTSTGA